MTSQIYDSIVIGSGAGGLVAGLSLARRGHSVLMLESGKQFGGMLNPFARRRYHFDVGLHYVGECGEGQMMRRLLDSVGLEAIRFREINPDCIDRYVFNGYQGRLVKGIDRWIDVLAADFPTERDSLVRFGRLLHAAMALSKVASERRLDWFAIARIVPRFPELIRALRETFATTLDRYFKDSRLKNIIAGPGGDIGLPPSRGSALMYLLVLTHFLNGAYYPIGGSGAMRDEAVRVLHANGAVLHRNHEVHRIEHLAGGGFAVFAGDARFEGRTVISNVDATLTFEMLDADVNARFRRKVQALRPSLSAFCVFLATDLDLPRFGITDANIWHYGNGDVETGYRKGFAGDLAPEDFFFLTAPTLKDPDSGRAPAGHHTVELITFAPADPFKGDFDSRTKRRGEAYEAKKAEIAQRMILGAERYIPGLRDHLLIEESATPATVWHYVRGRDGAVYGPELTPDQVVFGRLTPATPVPGLFLAGASTLGAGVLPCLQSGVLAAAECAKTLRKRGLFKPRVPIHPRASWSPVVR